MRKQKKSDTMGADALNQAPKLLTLILSHDDGPFKVIQDQGQDSTFVPLASKDSKVVRYIGYRRKMPIFFRLIFSWRRFQYLLLNWSSLWPLTPIIRWISRSRILDKIIQSIPTRFPNRNGLGTHIVDSNNGLASTLIVDTPEDWSLIGLKTLKALRFTLDNYEFDYLFRTNTSSYVDVKSLLTHIQSFPKSSVYAGLIGKVFGSQEFASGAGILLSRDVVERVCVEGEKWDHGLVDDIALGKLIDGFSNPRVGITPLPRLDLPTLEIAEQTDNSVIRSNFHFRCKSNSATETVEIMKYVHEVKTTSPQSE